MKWIKASEFKTGCALVTDQTKAVESVVVVKNGKPVGAFGTPPGKRRFRLGDNLGGITILGDIVSPIPDLWPDWDEKFERLYRRRS
jgi:hypothetical protein